MALKKDVDRDGFMKRASTLGRGVVSTKDPTGMCHNWVAKSAPGTSMTPYKMHNLYKNGSFFENVLKFEPKLAQNLQKLEENQIILVEIWPKLGQIGK